MTETERIIRHFNANAGKCKKHKLPVRLNWEGIWTVCCYAKDGIEGGCAIWEAEKTSPTDLMVRYQTEGM